MGLSLTIGGMGHAGGLALRGMMGGRGSTPPTTPSYAMSGAMPFESYIVGEVRPAFASFTALSIGAGAPVSFPVASVTFTLTNGQTGQVVTGFGAIAASIIAPNPATLVKVAIQLDFTPGAANPIAPGAYIATFYAADGLGQVCAAEGSIIVEGVGPGISLMGFSEGGGSG